MSLFGYDNTVMRPITQSLQTIMPQESVLPKKCKQLAAETATK